METSNLQSEYFKLSTTISELTLDLDLINYTNSEQLERILAKINGVRDRFSHLKIRIHGQSNVDQHLKLAMQELQSSLDKIEIVIKMKKGEKSTQSTASTPVSTLSTLTSSSTSTSTSTSSSTAPKQQSITKMPSQSQDILQGPSKTKPTVECNHENANIRLLTNRKYNLNVKDDGEIDGIDFDAKVRIKDEDLVDFSPDLILQEPSRHNINWHANITNFLDEYHSMPQEMLTKFKRTRVDKLLKLSDVAREDIIKLILELIITKYEDKIDTLVLPCIKMASMLKIIRSHLFVIEWARCNYKLGLYSDLANLRQRKLDIERCSNPNIKSTMETYLENDKLASLKRYYGNLKLIGLMYNEEILRSTDFVMDVLKFLFNQKKNYQDIYFDCFLDFFILVGNKLFTNISKTTGSYRPYRHYRKQDQRQFNTNLYLDYENIYTQLKHMPSVSTTSDTKKANLIELIENNWGTSNVS